MNSKKGLALKTIIVFILLIALLMFAIFFFTGIGTDARMLIDNFFSNLFG